MLNKSGKSKNFCLFLILEERLSVFRRWVWCCGIFMPAFSRLNDIPEYVYIMFYLSSWWTFRLLPTFVYCDNAAVNMIVQISFWDPTLNSFGYMPQSEIARSYDDSLFNFLRNCHAGERDFKNLYVKSWEDLWITHTWDQQETTWQNIW